MKLTAPKIASPVYMVMRTDHFTGTRSKQQADDAAKDMRRIYPNSGYVTVRAMVMDKYEPQAVVGDRTAFNSLGEELKLLREPKDRSITIEILPPDFDSDTGGFEVLISDGMQQAKGSGVYLWDAVQMARRNLSELQKQVQVVPVEVTAETEVVTKTRLSAASLSLKPKLSVPGLKR